ncbi:hypothetical protein DERF_008389 [Dermatophagoides farinae]|uniref:dTMP kinase n=1 Tax=Dermatophagoides farinae TaxID=6954 RepID=A0A922L6X7_DERFA|nr:hypothetical protein DERF_008389 [Dermatophagoides farinae]
MSSKRGMIIVLEGLDRVGKTTQAQKLVQSLRNQGKDTELIRFPDRSTMTGNLINQYLCGQTKLNDHVIHLLFAANRWEKFDQMLEMVKAGVAYTSAKGLDFDWCCSPEKGLIKPDCVLFLTTDINAISKREDFGQEIYDRKEFQKSVYEAYEKLVDKNYWNIIDTTNKTIDDVHDEILKVVHNRLENISKNISYLW